MRIVVVSSSTHRPTLVRSLPTHTANDPTHQASEIGNSSWWINSCETKNQILACFKALESSHSNHNSRLTFSQTRLCVFYPSGNVTRVLQWVYIFLGPPFLFSSHDSPTWSSRHDWKSSMWTIYSSLSLSFCACSLSTRVEGSKWNPFASEILKFTVRLVRLQTVWRHKPLLSPQFPIPHVCRKRNVWSQKYIKDNFHDLIHGQPYSTRTESYIGKKTQFFCTL